MCLTIEMRKIRRVLQRQGFTVTKTQGGHWRYDHPLLVRPVFSPDTPSDRRGLKNFLAEIRRNMQPREAERISAL